jgi:LPXTG-motif cell wall-anchored protein
LNFEEKGEKLMDSITMVRIVAGLLFAVGLAFLIQRRRKKVS